MITGFMKEKVLVLIFTAGATLAPHFSLAEEGKRKPSTQSMPAPIDLPTEASSEQGLVKHIVIFRYAPETSPADTKMITTRFLALKHECLRNGKPYIVSVDTGEANSPEKADLGLTHAFIVTFKSENDRDYYVGRLSAGKANTALLKNKNGSDLFDPAHEKFKLDVGPFLYVPKAPVVLDGAVGNGVFVFDFTTSK